MRIYQKLTKLTPAEQQFAADNHWVLEWYFRTSDDDIKEFYDVAAIGYLKAVKSWCAREELHQYCFSTIARKAIRSYISNERKKAGRRIKAISLDAAVDDLSTSTLADTITYDNYLNQYVC